MLRRLFVISFITFSPVALADTFDINLSNSAAQFKYNKVSGIAGKSDLFAAFMYNDANSMLGEAGLLVLNEEGSIAGLSLGIGAKAVIASLNKLAPSRVVVSGVALSGQIRFEVPTDRRFALVGEYHYAPKIISFGDADNFYQTGVRAEFAMSALTQAYVGYRTTKFILSNNPANGVLDNGAHLGVRLTF